MDAGTILAEAREHTQSAPAGTSTRDPLAAWERASDPVEVEGGYGSAFYARRKSTGVMHACFQRGTTGRVVGIPVICAPALGLVPAPEPEPEKPAEKPAKTTSKSRAQK